ncbi:MAG TPA: 2-C-methyl-D-erythritol 4-phosphate cytidylyltransferase [Rikenellaceae bacterium]|nr:2-C-methyl-D-erythritol 4-phosphate cytidylyltransferase [Rikenellaceae bacterium]HRR49961.1 2-C-methyl-D-erythritol 4-phosphate cytidylyltransferase [Bacteroidales bacterium]
MDKRHFAIIVAGGVGTRMGTDIPKQFINLGGKPLLLRTLEVFLNLAFPVEIIIALPVAYMDRWKETCAAAGLDGTHKIVAGGITRFHSVKNALSIIPKGVLVAVHDGVRPFVHSEFIESLYAKASECGSAIPVVKPADSMRVLMSDGKSKPVNREEFVFVQTPQVFDSEILLNAYEQPYSQSFTDDASVVESAGCQISLVEGDPINIKITQQEDLLIAKAILSVF